MQRRGDNALHILLNSGHIISDHIFRKFNNIDDTLKKLVKRLAKSFFLNHV